MAKHSEAPGYNAPPALATFPREEFEARWRRLQVAMENHGMSALVATNEPNYRYLTGHRNQRWPNMVRPRAVILPLKGEPIMLVGEVEAWGIHEVTHVRDVRTYRGVRADEGYGLFLVRAILETLAELGINSKTDRVGIERGGNMRVGLSVDDFLLLEKALAPVELADASQIWWWSTVVKSPLEIDCIRRAAQITSRAFDQIQQDIRIGMTEMDVERRFNELQLSYGCERPTYVPVNFHRGRDPREHFIILGTSTNRKLEKDMSIVMDGGCTVDGYWSDFNREFATGKPSKKTSEVYEIMWQAVEAAIAAVKPGRPISDVAKAQLDIFRKAGWQDVATIHGIYGHGLGLFSTAPPYVTMLHDTIMSEGLFFTIEPTASIPGFGVSIQEENVVVTADGCELLSKRASRTIPIVG